MGFAEKGDFPFQGLKAHGRIRLLSTTCVSTTVSARLKKVHFPHRNARHCSIDFMTGSAETLSQDESLILFVKRQRCFNCISFFFPSFSLNLTFHTFHLGFVHPPQDVAHHQCLPLSSVAFLFQVVPSFLVMSSCHLLRGRPLD